MTSSPATAAAAPLAVGVEPARDQDRWVAYWLLLCCLMIALMVVIGGVTRLTDSGLSITEWRPLLGWIPPLSQADWEDLFAKYREIPQYQLLNLGMSLAEFQNIFWWEYIHRFWGRLIGVVFLLPLLWFVLRGHVRGRLAVRLGGLFVLGGLQGALGWYMVASGLVDRVSVSPYRLTAHLGLAVAIYAYALWLALDLLAVRGRAEASAGVCRLRAGYAAFSALVVLTMLSGGFVAGLDAGMTYNTFPLMDGRLVPDGYGDLQPWWLNLFENIAAVQFNHRVLATVVVLSAAGLWGASLKVRLWGRAVNLILAVYAMALAQAGLGIATLLLVVPVSVAAAHQGGAMVLLTLSLWTAHELGLSRRSRPAPAGNRHTAL